MAHERVYANAYYDPVGHRTYQPLYGYYLPPNYHADQWFFSPVYSQRYNDGYGYNFYYGEYGYYEYSDIRTDIVPDGRGGHVVV